MNRGTYSAEGAESAPLSAMGALERGDQMSRFAVARLAFVVLAAVTALSVAGCAPAASTPEKEAVESAAAAPSHAEQVAQLIDVDTAVTPDGVTVDQLITIDEARAIIGMPEVFFAVPAG